MEESTFDLITGLCSELVEGTPCSQPSNKNYVVKKLRSQAYEIVLNHRNVDIIDDLENSPKMLLANILGHVYHTAKVKGEWTKDMMEDVGNLIDKAEILAECNPSFMSVLRFLLCIADIASAPGIVHNQELSYGLEMKILISDHSFKHKPLIKSQCTFNPEIFEVPVAMRSENVQNIQVLSEMPGIGLKHQQFFTPSKPFTSVESRKFEEDVNNGNWFHSKLNNMAIPVSNTITDPRTSMHLDEGYETPDQDILEPKDASYIRWEDMNEDFDLIYSWENFGSVVVKKELQFIFQRNDSVDPISKVIHAFDTTSSHSAMSNPTPLKTISVDELELAFKNLLIGVESTIFQYDQDRDSFVLQKGLCLKGSTTKTFEEYCEDFIECGNRFRQLSNFTESSTKCGLVFQTLCNNMRQYLQCYRGVVLKMPAMLSLLETRDWLYKLSSQMQFLISLCPDNSERASKDLLVYLCDKMPVLYRHDLSYIYYYILQSCFTVYFTFLSKWIFEGVTDRMWEDEFFIRCNPLTEDMYNRKFWFEGFVLDQTLVPNCLKGLESKLLLCGKSMALLKLCASEDPICKQVKREHPEIICCFNKNDLERVEEKFESYKEKCKVRCQELFGTTTLELHNEEYYAALMAKTLNEIKGRQEEERRFKAEKKQFEFNILKKEMEDAKARKIEEKITLMKNEQKLIEEAEKIDQLNELRRQEERKKIMHLYSTLSEAADRRRDRAEWKIKRAELHDKRCAFWNAEKEWLEENIKQEKEKSQHNEEFKLLSAEKSLEKYLNTYSPIPGSGDYITTIEKDESSQEAMISSAQHVQESLSRQSLLGNEGDMNDYVKSEKLEYSIKDPLEVNDDKREWSIALGVAEQARQSAFKFKQRNMHNDYNIITGEETTFESKFGKQLSQETKKESFPSDVVSCDFKDNSLNDNKDIRDDPGADVNEFITANAISERTQDEVNKGDSQSAHQTITHKKLEISINEPEISTSGPEFMLDASLTLTQSERESHFQEIDMTSIYQNVQRSIMIPLLTQLELTGDAISRLFSKHCLLQHMECITKHFFLLEGEFARNLTANLFKEAQKAQHPSYLFNVMKLNSLLRCAVGTTVDEEYTERLSFYFKEMPSVLRTLDPGMLNCLSLSYKTYWPINIIITDELITKQDQIFKHLLKLHRMSWALEEVIYLLKDKKLFSSPEYRNVQLYRHVMTHFITSIKQYITAVLMEKTWCEFKKKLEKATTVDMMFDLYRFYIRNVNSKCFLGSARTHTEEHFNQLFKEILKFYEALRSGEWIHNTTTDCYQHSNFSRLNHTFNSFKKMADHLVYIFRKMSNSFPYIEQLATILTLNDFYMVKKKDHSL